MAKIDEIKEWIGWLKVIFGLLTAVDIGLIGWIAKNYEQANPVLLYVALLIVIACTIGIVFVNKQAHRKIKELRDL